MKLVLAAVVTLAAALGACQPPEPVRQPAPEPLREPVIDPDDPVEEQPVPLGVPSAGEGQRR